MVTKNKEEIEGNKKENNVESVDESDEVFLLLDKTDESGKVNLDVITQGSLETQCSILKSIFFL